MRSSNEQRRIYSKKRTGLLSAQDGAMTEQDYFQDLVDKHGYLGPYRLVDDENTDRRLWGSLAQGRFGRRGRDGQATRPEQKERNQ